MKSKIESQKVGNLISCAIQLQSLNMYIHHVAALQNQDLKTRFQVQILFYKLKDTSSSSMTRKVIFRFEGANPSSKAMFQVDWTGFLSTLLRLCMWMSLFCEHKDAKPACGLLSVYILSQVEKSKCKEKEEGKNCIFFPGKIYECKGNICIRYRVWITFLDEQGYHLTFRFYFREPVKFREEKTPSTLRRKLLGYSSDDLFSFILPFDPSLSDLDVR